MPPSQSWEELPKQRVSPHADFHTSKPPPRIRKPRARKNSYRNKNALKVSVKRGTEELSGRERRIRINELLYFLPSHHLNTLTLKQLDTLLHSHRCSMCEKVFRLVSGVKIHMEDVHEKRTILSYFKKTKKNNKINAKMPATDQCTYGFAKIRNNLEISLQNPRASVGKTQSTKIPFKCNKTPTYKTKPRLMSPKSFRKKSALPQEYKTADQSPADSVRQPDNSYHDGTSMPNPLSPHSLYTSSEKKSSVGDYFKCRKTTKYLTKPKLMSPKTYRKHLPLPDVRERFKTQAEAEHIHSSKPPHKGNLSTLQTQVIQQQSCKPKLMTQKKWKRKLALTQQKNNEDELSAITVGEHKLMTERLNKDSDYVENDSDVKEFFEFVKSQPVLLN